jgi:hypothetical protein
LPVCRSLQAHRAYYGSKAAFLADCQMLVDAARAYNTPGVGGRLATPNLINLAQGVVDEGLRVLGENLHELTYWEKRIEVRALLLLHDCPQLRVHCNAASMRPASWLVGPSWLEPGHAIPCGEAATLCVVYLCVALHTQHVHCTCCADAYQA